MSRTLPGKKERDRAEEVICRYGSCTLAVVHLLRRIDTLQAYAFGVSKTSQCDGKNTTVDHVAQP